MTTELNELSKTTLRSYASKAKDSEREHQAASTRASTEYLDKKDHDPAGAADAVARSVKHQFKSVKRMVGAYKAKDKLREAMNLQEKTEVHHVDNRKHGHDSWYEVKTGNKHHMISHNRHDDPPYMTGDGREGHEGDDAKSHPTLSHAVAHLRKLGHDVSATHFKHIHESSEVEGKSLLEALLNKDFVTIREAIGEMMTEAAVERIDELSKETLKSYAKKARTSSDRLFKKAEKEEDKAMSTNGGKYPEKVERHQKAASAAIAKGVKRDVGIYLANRKIKSKGD